jgi:hypothetical protein
MTSIYKPIRKLKVYKNVSFVLVSIAFADVHFLLFDELNTRFLNIAPFVCKRNILNSFLCLGVSIRVTI